MGLEVKCLTLSKPPMVTRKAPTRQASRGNDKQGLQSSLAIGRQNPMPNTSAGGRRSDGNADLASNIDRERGLDKYDRERQKLVADDRGRSWDASASSAATDMQHRAAMIVANVREKERIDPALYGNLAGEAVPSSESHDMGGRFLHNRGRIERSMLFEIVKRMPKGGHLHLHFNSEIPAEVLFPHARNLATTMYIRTTRRLRSVDDYTDCEIVFNVFEAAKQTSNVFSADYNADAKIDGNSPWMLWASFRELFPTSAPSSVVEKYTDHDDGLDLAERWAREKMVITEHDAYNDRQTHNGVWACFNQGTRAFKGLLAYESVYRWYIGAVIDSMVADRVMYAELRPMLLDKFIPSDDGKRQLGHVEQMNIVCEEVKKKQKELDSKGQLDAFPFGLKIIYATPRSIPKDRMQTELEDCITLKLRFPDLICGFDLVGAEDRPNHVGFYADQLLGFTKTCESLGIEIPFMFHAGETLLDTGGSHDPDRSNLYDSLLLKAKRIGHGCALLKHPLLVEKYKEANICLELCPISNELLHLCGNIRQHPYPQLLAAGLHCTLNADNPSLFRGASTASSTLSHEFYQVLVGDPRMTLHGCKQLAQWSIEHSCISMEEVRRGKEIHAREFEAFCRWIVENFAENENMELS